MARLAAVLRGLGVQPEDRVATLSADSDTYHELMLAARWAGAAVVPVNTRWAVSGGTHVFPSRFDAAAMARAVERRRVTDVVLVPTMLQMLVDSPEAARADMSSLRRVL
ncbi:AMP-binding protein [Pseudonocardia xinjiangensis]|uniref:AMP-binding protein n=1 Tax=Pseudonocardia xinjiangensis TaxID=75289 RepID=UPI001B7D0436|nr:AMP-binding protein [Pseudonocardia xinjiangensis]